MKEANKATAKIIEGNPVLKAALQSALGHVSWNVGSSDDKAVADAIEANYCGQGAATRRNVLPEAREVLEEVRDKLPMIEHRPRRLCSLSSTPGRAGAFAPVCAAVRARGSAAAGGWERRRRLGTAEVNQPTRHNHFPPTLLNALQSQVVQ